MPTNRPLLALLLPLLTLTLTRPAHPGPTVSTDLDLGTATKTPPSNGVPGVATPDPLYLVGFDFRAGWRFDVGPVWLLPELGAGYAVERFQYVVDPTTTVSRPSAALTRFFGGGRFGWSGALRPELRFEPSVYGHVGGGWYASGTNGTAFDVGLALDLRIREHFIVGAQVGYDVVTVPAGPAPVEPPLGGAILVAPSAVVDPWVSYGIHAGWLFW